MARVTPQLPSLNTSYQLFISPPEPILTQILVFYLPYAGHSSRANIHIYTACGYGFYQRMMVDPSSALYQAINHMPPEKTESEIYRALAFALCRYFVELTVGVKAVCTATANITNSRSTEAFSAAHAGELAASLVRIEENGAIQGILATLTPRIIPSIDVDLILPPPGAPNMIRYNRLLQYMGDLVKKDPTLKRRPSRADRTRAKSAAALHEPNPEKVVGKLAELLDTELKYVEKLQKFVREIARPERQYAQSAVAPEPGMATIARLFPESMDDIYALNYEFLTDIKAVLESDRDRELENMADIFLKHFPGFQAAYTNYIGINPPSSGLLVELIRSDTNFARRISSYGEQYVKSILIEPIQRLPRYNLIIDGVLNYVAPADPAFAKLTQARTIISKICEMQSAPAQERAETISRLSALISGWPPNFKPAGSLVTAVDLTEVMPPFKETAEKATVIILVFQDSIAFVSRPNLGSMKAIGVLTEITMPTSMQSSSRREGADLHFAGCTSLKYTRFSTSDNGKALWITLTKDLEEVYDMRESAVGMKKFLPSGPWENKANELVEEIIQAQLQCKTQVKETRWSGNSNSKFDELELWTSIYDQDGWHAEVSGSRAIIKLGDESTKFDTKSRDPKIKAWEILVLINYVPSGKMRLDIMGVGTVHSSDTVGELDVLSTLTKRLSGILERHSHIMHSPITAAVIQNHRRVIKSLSLSTPDVESSPSKLKFRPPSPVKLLHTFLGHSTNSINKSTLRGTAFENTTEMARPTVMLERSHSVIYRTGEGGVEDISSRIKEISFVDRQGLDEASRHVRVERILDAYLTVLQSKLLTELTPDWVYARRGSNSTTVDQLNKALLKDYSNTAAAEAASLELVLNAFEKFLSTAWRESMGTMLTPESLRDLQAKFDNLDAQQFEKYFKDFLGDLTPQNKRAFRKIAEMFAILLDNVTSQDTKTQLVDIFSELLVATGLSSSKISEVAQMHLELMVQFLINVEAYFGSKFEPNFSFLMRSDVAPIRQPYNTPEVAHDVTAQLLSGSPTNSPGRGRSRGKKAKNDDEDEVSPSRIDALKKSWRNRGRFVTYSPTKSELVDEPSVSAGVDQSSLKRSKTTGTPVANPVAAIAGPTNSSSLRRRLGLSAHIDGGTKDAVKSMLRTRSNRSGKERERSQSPHKMSGMLSRTGSTDTDNRRPVQHERPLSRDRLVLNASSLSKNTGPLSPIVDSPSGSGHQQSFGDRSRRKKRRSSLSDLVPARELIGLVEQKSPAPPQPISRTGSGRSDRSVKKENYVTNMGPPPVPVHARHGSTSSIGSGRETLGLRGRSSTTERPASVILKGSGDYFSDLGGAMKSPGLKSTGLKSPSLKSPSPTRTLGPKINAETQNMTRASDALNAELALIGQELSRGASSARGSNSSASINSITARASISSTTSVGDDNVRRKVRHMETKLNNSVTDLMKRYEDLHDEMRTTAAKQQEGMAELASLNQDLKSENDILYERFNQELQAVAKMFSAKGGEDEKRDVVRLLAAAQEREARLKSEIYALKKENIELRAGKPADL